MQPLSILFGAGFTVAVSYSLGAVLLQKSCSDPAIRFVAGSAILSALVFSACALGLVYPPVFLSLGILAIAGSLPYWQRPDFPHVATSRIWLIFVPFVVLYAANAMAPEISFDGSRYHLGLVARFFREHGFGEPIRENMYAGFPEGVEMLYLFAFTFGRHSAAALTHLAFLVALTWQVYTWGVQEGREVAAVAAAFLVFASPIMGVDGTSAYIDVAVAAIVFTVFRVLELWSEKRTPVLLGAAGLLAGFAFAGKYTVFLAVPYALWRVGRRAPVVAAAAGLVIVPWLVKNWLWFHNPLAPFFNQYFPNQYITISFEREYLQAQVTAIWPQVPLELTVFGSLGGVLGPIFLLSPLALIRAGRGLLLPAALFGVAFFWNTGARFLIPSLPFVALAMCLAIARYPRVLVGMMAAHAVLSWPTVLRRYCHPDAWRLDKVTYREALRIKPEEGFLESNLPYYGATRMVERATPPGATVFTEIPLPEAYTSRKILVAYQSAANIVSRRVWFTGFVPEHAPVWRTTFRFPERVAGGFRIVQTATGSANWTIHEVVAFDGNRELRRDNWSGPPETLDGRLASLWMSGDSLRPGQTIQFDFQSPERLDRIVVESAPDLPDARLALELRDPDLKWSGIAGAPQFEQVSPPSDLRRQAAEELRHRGIDYFLAFDGEFGAEDLRVRAGDWGVTQVAEYKGARLYRLP